MSLHQPPAAPGVDRVPAQRTKASSTRSRVLFVLACALVGAMLAVPAAWLWNLLADAPDGVVFEGEVFYDEVQLNVQAEMTRVDGVWKVSAARLLQRFEGVAGCALAS